MIDQWARSEPGGRARAGVPAVGLIVAGVIMVMGPIGFYFWIFAFPIVPVLLVGLGIGLRRFGTSRDVLQTAAFEVTAVAVAAAWLAWIWMFLGGRAENADRAWAFGLAAGVAGAALAFLAVALRLRSGGAVVRGVLLITAAGLVGVAVGFGEDVGSVLALGAVIAGFPASLVLIGIAALPTERDQWLVGALRHRQASP